LAETVSSTRLQGLTGLDELDADTGVTSKQRRLAEILEMILAAQAIHKSVLNLPHDLHQVRKKRFWAFCFPLLLSDSVPRILFLKF
jgi:hypothetical protein